MKRNQQARARILIVEDEIITAEQFRQDLTDSGYDVIGVAHTGQDAITLAQKQPPDGIVMDIKLRGPLDGIDTAIRIQNELGRTVKILFVSALSQPGLIAGPFALKFLKKPVSSDDLKQALLDLGL